MGRASVDSIVDWGKVDPAPSGQLTQEAASDHDSLVHNSPLRLAIAPPEAGIKEKGD
jgi:hypothetical protein